jgi:hypothetical protein
MAKDKKRAPMRYSDEELTLIKATFAENDDLIRAVRKVFLQMPLDVIDKAELSAAFKGNKGAQKILRKTYLPTLDANAPINQIIDLWMTVEVKDKSVSEVWAQLQARTKLIQYLDEQLQRIESGAYEKITGLKFADFLPTPKKTPNEAMEELIARNTAVSHNEWQLNQLSVLAGQKDESVDQTQERLQRDSSK